MHLLSYKCLGGALVGSVQEPRALALSGQLVLLVVLPRAAVIWCTALHKWLLTEVTLERLSFADGIVLTTSWTTTVRRQPEEIGEFPSSDDGIFGLPSPEVLVVNSPLDPTGTMTNPMGRRGMQQGSSPLIAS